MKGFRYEEIQKVNDSDMKGFRYEGIISKRSLLKGYSQRVFF